MTLGPLPSAAQIINLYPLQPWRLKIGKNIMNTTNNELKKQLKYKSDCDKLRPYMVADLSHLPLNDRTGRQTGRRRNILAALAGLFPGQKFGVRYAYGSQKSDVEIYWTDGPTVAEVEKSCNWSVFCDSWQRLDPYTDYVDRGTRQFIDFAEQYGGGYLDCITFSREYNTFFFNECREYANSLFESLGLDPRGKYHRDTEEYYNIRNSSPYLQCNTVSLYWLQVATVAEIVASQISHYLPPTAPTDTQSSTTHIDTPTDSPTEAPADGLTLEDIPGGVAVTGDSRTTYRNRQAIRAAGATWHKSRQQWQATDPASVARLRQWFGLRNTPTQSAG